MRVIIQNEFQMVVDVELIFADHAKTIAMLELKLHCVRVDDPRRYREIVHQQMHEVFVFDSLRDFL